jgi:prepilin-type N-terminal cleavage/methylation domain-containing protein
MVKHIEKGFTLAELLIALAILGVIATFTIPKVLNSGTSGQNTAIFKETASTVSGAFSAYQLNNAVTTATTTANLTSSINYVNIDTTATNYGSGACNAANIVCLKLHNGGVLSYNSTHSFGTAGRYITFNVDPDGTGAATAASIDLVDNGRLTSGGRATGLTAGNGGTATAHIATDPIYVDW